MSENIYDLAHGLERGIRETDEFKSLEEAYKKSNRRCRSKGKIRSFS